MNRISRAGLGVLLIGLLYTAKATDASVGIVGLPLVAVGFLLLLWEDGGGAK